MPDHPNPSPPVPSNAFTPEFLDRLHFRDEPAGSFESEMLGPWRIEAQRDGFVLFHRWESAERGDRPFARFRRREDALLWFAILPSLAHSPLYSLRKEATPTGFLIEGGGEVLGSLQTYDPAVAAAAATAAALVRSPLSLAAALEAAGSFVLRSAGDLLGRSGLVHLVGA